MTEPAVFEEKQYLGFNKRALLTRIVIALFCFTAYYWSQNPKPVDVSGIRIGSYPSNYLPDSGQLFFLMGIAILSISAGLLFKVHMHTKVYDNSMIIDGMWGSRKVKIDLSSIVDVKREKTKKFINWPVYNLHYKGTIQFYCHGNEAIEMNDRDGLKYLIGTQKPEELERVILMKIGNK